MSDIKVIIEWPQKVDTSSMSAFLNRLWRFGPPPPASLRGLDVEFITRTTPAASISTLNIAIDSSQVKEATKALNDLADAAACARQAIEAL